MIVRILGEGQYRMPEESFRALNDVDDRIEAAALAGDEDAFHDALVELTAAIKAHGRELAADEFHPSDAVVPGPDTTLDEARELIGDEGLIPG